MFLLFSEKKINVSALNFLMITPIKIWIFYWSVFLLMLYLSIYHLFPYIEKNLYFLRNIKLETFSLEKEVRTLGAIKQVIYGHKLTECWAGLSALRDKTH